MESAEIIRFFTSSDDIQGLNDFFALDKYI